jgi:hypothetical protein
MAKKNNMSDYDVINLSNHIIELCIMYVCMYKGWAFTALAPRPTVV